MALTGQEAQDVQNDQGKFKRKRNKDKKNSYNEEFKNFGSFKRKKIEHSEENNSDKPIITPLVETQKQTKMEKKKEKMKVKKLEKKKEKEKAKKKEKEDKHDKKIEKRKSESFKTMEVVTGHTMHHHRSKDESTKDKRSIGNHDVANNKDSKGEAAISASADEDHSVKSYQKESNSSKSRSGDKDSEYGLYFTQKVIAAWYSNALGMSNTIEFPHYFAESQVAVNLIRPIEPDVQYVIDQVADLVLQRGEDFEQKLREEHPNDRRYKFLFDEHSKEFAYYRTKLVELSNPELVTKDGPILSGFLYGIVPRSVRNRYKAAGVLPYARTPNNEIVLLLGCEDRSAKKREQKGFEVWLHFGGKRNPEDTGPEATAIREFNEETGGLFADQLEQFYQRLSHHSADKIWYEAGKYVLYFLEISYDEELPNKFAKLEVEKMNHIDQINIQWVPCQHVVTALELSCDITVQGKIALLFHFFSEMMTEVYGVTQFLSSLKERPSLLQ